MYVFMYVVQVWCVMQYICMCCMRVCVCVYGILCVFICVSGACVVHVWGKLCGSCMCVHVCMSVVHMCVVMCVWCMCMKAKGPVVSSSGAANFLTGLELTK